MSSEKDMMNDDDNNNNNKFNEMITTSTKKNKEVTTHHTDIQIINESKFFYHSVCFDFQFQLSNLRQFSDKTVIKKEITHFSIINFSFKDLNFNQIITALH